MEFIKNRKLGISTKTAILSGIIVLILLGMSSIISLYLQSSFSRLMIDDFTISQSRELEEYTVTQNNLIREDCGINS